MKQPAPHQQDALRALAKWYRSEQAPKGGILALPTGAGKTFTAIRFLTSGPLSDGYKVLWLAHTHHLLEQAFFGFGPPSDLEAVEHGYELGHVREPRTNVQVRVVSNSVGFYRVHQITKDDDIVIGTLQTVARAFEDNKQKGLHAFLKSARGNLVVVFDEAHHAPAPTYRKLMLAIHQKYPASVHLGLTATPTYSDERRIGWLKKVFPQGIVHQVLASDLMAAGVLSRPVLEQPSTLYTPEFDEREYQMWMNTYRDLPENIIDQLAQSRERNAMIADTYVNKRELYGKTLMFADRWYQCDQLREMLRNRGVRADVVYSQVDRGGGTAEQRNARDKSENAKVLSDFRKDKLDVLINVRMLTEGTDVPNVQTVFLTRQTTSKILLTQMIGRALRGPRFGGTDRAFIVSFIDNWKQSITWAGYDQIEEGLIEDEERSQNHRPPMQLISIELVRKLARMLDEGLTVSPVAFQSMMPVGWYRCEYLTTMNGGDDMTSARQMVMVMEGDEQSFVSCIEDMLKKRKDADASEELSIETVVSRLTAFEKKHFQADTDRLGGTVQDDLFHILRHIGQHGQPPQFFRFEDRELHNLDALAEEFSMNRRMNVFELDESLQAEYNRKSRFWNVFYYNYDLFKTQYDACVNRLLQRNRSGGESSVVSKVIKTTGRVANREPSDEVKEQVKRRDNNTCLCCGEDKKRLLQIDHIAPAYYGGDNSIENLQTLCAPCNQQKSINVLNFSNHKTDLLSAPKEFPFFATPEDCRSAIEWEKYLRRCINTFYRCGAVESVKIGGRGEPYYNWVVTLYAGNPTKWLKRPGKALLRTINVARYEQNVPQIDTITIMAPEDKPVELS
ncbi:DEAD/DEAH box helicase family protein [bacterium]|nr:DEAD/DEAH box helicase family protein [bacterium]